MSIAYTDDNTQTALAQSTLLEVASPFEDDPTEPGSASAKKAKGKKTSIKELQQRIAELEVKLEVTRPEQVERMIESHRNAQLTVRDLNYHLRERDSTIIRLNARIRELEQGTDDQKHDASTDTHQVAQLEQERDQWRSQCTQVEQEKASLILDNNDLRQTNAYLEQQDREHLEEKAELEAERDTLQEHLYAMAKTVGVEHHQDIHDATLAALAADRDEWKDAAEEIEGLYSHALEEIKALKEQKHDASESNQAQPNESEKDALISELRTMNEQLAERLRQERTDRAYKELYQQQVEEHKRHIKKLPNTKMGSSDKLVAMDYIDQAAARHLDIADLSQPFHPVMEQMAARLGLSEAQLTRINQTQKRAGSWTHDVQREFVERQGRKEMYTCTVTVALDKILSDPESIEKPEGPKGSHQGGARVRRCKDCGSDDLDRYALEYCRNCKTAHAQLLPGLRSDANIRDAIEAVKQDRYTIQDHVFEYSQQDDQAEPKHDAFTQEEVQQLSTQLTDTIEQIDTQLTMQATQPAQTSTTIEQKHDAFVDQHTQGAEHSSPTTHNQELQPCPTKQKHDAFIRLHDQDAEQLASIESKMQGKVTLEESLHNAKESDCSCCIGIERGLPPTQPCWRCHLKMYEWNHLNRRWVCMICPL